MAFGLLGLGGMFFSIGNYGW